MAIVAAIVTFAFIDLSARRLLSTHVTGAMLGSPRGKILLAPSDAGTLFVGDSRVLAGLDPAAFAATCDCGTAFNGAVASTDTRSTQLLAMELASVMSPQQVIIGLSEWDLSDGVKADVFTAAAELVPPWRLNEFGLPQSPERIAQTGIERAWPLYRHRGDIRKLAEVLLGLTPNNLSGTGRGGYAPLPVSSSRPVDANYVGYYRGIFFGRFGTDGVRADALRTMISDLRSRGASIILVMMPAHPALFAASVDDVDSLRAAVMRMAEGRAEVIDLTAPSWLGLPDFWDPIHLNEVGAARFSERLGTIVRERLRARGV